jgi:hypothetical protein
MKMVQIECPETSAYKIQTPGNHPEENIQHTEHGENLKSKILTFCCSGFRVNLHCLNNTSKTKNVRLVFCNTDVAFTSSSSNFICFSFFEFWRRKRRTNSLCQTHTFCVTSHFATVLSIYFYKHNSFDFAS